MVECIPKQCKSALEYTLMNWQEVAGNIAKRLTAPFFMATTVYIPEDRRLANLITTSEGRGYKGAYQGNGNNGIEVHVPTGGAVQMDIDGKLVVVQDIRAHGDHHEGAHVKVKDGWDHHLHGRGEKLELPDLPNVLVVYVGPVRNDEFPRMVFSSTDKND